MSTQPGSAYSLDKREEKPETHTMTVLVDNEPGVLARVIGLFSGRGYNIESLTVSETEHEAHLSRITIVTSGPPMVIEQIQHQLERLIPVHSVTDLTVKGNPIERELAMVKVAGKGEKRVEALRLAEAFRASVIDASTEHFVFEITGKQSKIEQFIVLMQPLGLVEVAFGLVGLRWEEYVEVDDAYVRPAEVDSLLGNPEKARRKLGWEPRISFEDMIREMLETDLRSFGVSPATHLGD
jgi:acetolactate synthase-1/3 small subunit